MEALKAPSSSVVGARIEARRHRGGEVWKGGGFAEGLTDAIDHPTHASVITAGVGI